MFAKIIGLLDPWRRDGRMSTRHECKMVDERFKDLQYDLKLDQPCFSDISRD